MDRSIYLARMIGIYLLIVSVAMFIRMPTFIDLIKQLLQNGVLLFVTGFFTTVLGIVMVVLHNKWVRDWRVLVTIFSWIVLIKGTALLVWPYYLDLITTDMLECTASYYLAAGIAFLFGLFLIVRSRV